ncbi:MAG: Spy/CpxP family protein refolding chaperone [Proteobacteria bacterium]|nr:Spy/CpxP family protein refolding chaperone [Pseudomonadota bacterium]
MYKKLLGIVIFSLSLIFSQTLFADESMCKKGLKTMVESLELKDDQETKIEDIISQMKTTMKENGSQMDSLKSQIQQQLNSTSMDEKTVNKLVDQKVTLIGNMMKARIKAENQIFTLLTPEQKDKLQKMMKVEEDKIADKFKSCQYDD